MVISQTPLRVSIIGGGTDYPEYYRYSTYGSVVSIAIGIYVYVIVKGRYDNDIAVNWTQHERVSSVDEVRHELVRESMRYLGITGGIEITTISDIDTAGSGLGSSSAVLVGLLNALHAYKGDTGISGVQLAQEAVHIEQVLLHKPIGIQDAWPSAIGGANYFKFYSDGTVSFNPVVVPENCFVLMKVGSCRESDTICARVGQGVVDHKVSLDLLRFWSDRLGECSDPGVKLIGYIMDSGWDIKKHLATGITNSTVDSVINKLKRLGATGCKLCGAGSSGYVLGCIDPAKRGLLLDSIGLQHLPVTIVEGSSVIYNE